MVARITIQSRQYTRVSERVSSTKRASATSFCQQNRGTPCVASLSDHRVSEPITTLHRVLLTHASNRHASTLSPGLAPRAKKSFGSVPGEVRAQFVGGSKTSVVLAWEVAMCRGEATWGVFPGKTELRDPFYAFDDLVLRHFFTELRRIRDGPPKSRPSSRHSACRDREVDRQPL